MASYVALKFLKILDGRGSRNRKGSVRKETMKIQQQNDGTLLSI